MNEGDRTENPETDKATLPSDVQARWDALADTVGQMASATGDAEGFQAAFNAMTHVGRGIDHQQILNAMHVPKDAGEHTEALRGMLVRIPDGWGRWISCDRGWYPLLVELDEQLRTLLPNYELHQVKEKYGGLRYYFEPGEEIRDPNDPEPPIPARGRSDAELAQWEQAHEAWCERLETYRQTPEGQKLVDTAEGRAGVTCELCGAAGRLHRTPARAPWYKTLCPDCAEREGYVPSRESDSQ
jgi:hypothetical protein